MANLATRINHVLYAHAGDSVLCAHAHNSTTVLVCVQVKVVNKLIQMHARRAWGMYFIEL